MLRSASELLTASKPPLLYLIINTISISPSLRLPPSSPLATPFWSCLSPLGSLIPSTSRQFCLSFLSFPSYRLCPLFLAWSTLPRFARSTVPRFSSPLKVLLITRLLSVVFGLVRSFCFVRTSLIFLGLGLVSLISSLIFIFISRSLSLYLLIFYPFFFPTFCHCLCSTPFSCAHFVSFYPFFPFVLSFIVSFLL